MDSGSLDTKPKCIHCHSPEASLHLGQDGPFCIKHWLEAVQVAGNAGDLKYGTCVYCGGVGVILMLGEYGPYCVVDYLDKSVAMKKDAETKNDRDT